MSTTSPPPSLEDRIAALEQQVTALENAPAPDSLTPNYITVNPDGTASIDFAGATFTDATINNATINTATVENLTIPEAPNPDFSAQNAVVWTDASGNPQGYIQGNQDDPTDHSISIGVPAPAVGFLPDAAVVVGSGSGGGNASGVSIILGQAAAPVIRELDLYDDTGASDFLIVGEAGEVTPPSLSLRFGSGSFGGSGGYNAYIPIPHGLPNGIKTFGFIPALATGGGSWAASWGQYAASDATNLYVALSGYPNVFTSGVTFFYNWWAIGTP